MSTNKPPEDNQLALWCVAQESQPSFDCVAAYSHHSDPASPLIRGDIRVAQNSRGRVVIGLDTGERSGKTVATDGAIFVSYKNPAEAMRDPRWPSGSLVVFENSACSFDPALRGEFDAVMRLRGMHLYPIHPRNTKNRRKDWGIEEKSDQIDAEVLRRIGLEGVVARAKWDGKYRRQWSDHALVRSRQLGYDLTHQAMPGWLRDAVLSAMKHRPPPMCAVDAGAAIATARGIRWVDPPDYRLITPVFIATQAAGWLAAKRMARLRGICRSNHMHFPLRRMPRQERKRVMKAQDKLLRWCWEKLRSGGANVLTLREVA